MSKTSKNSMIYGFGMIVLAVAGLLNTVVLTRVLDSHTYAMYGLLVTAANTIVCVLSFGFNHSYMRFYYDHSQTKLKFLLRCITVPVVLAICFIAVLLEPEQRLVHLLLETKLTPLSCVFLAVYLFFLMLHQFTARGVRMEECAWNYVLSESVFKLGFVGVVCLFFWQLTSVSFEQIVLAFALCVVAAIFINLAVVLRVAKQKNASQIQSFSQTDLLRFGFPLMIHNSFLLVIPFVEKMMIRQLSGWETLGIYTAASVFFTPISLLTNAISNVWEPVVYQNYKRHETFKPIFHDVAFAATVMSVMGIACSILLRRWLVLLLDTQYFAAYRIVPTVICSACFQMTAGIYSTGINIARKTVHYIVAPIIQIVSSVILCVLLIPQFGLIGIATAALISILLSRGYRVVVGLHYYSTGVSEKKSLFLWICCVVACVATLIYTAFWLDAVLFAVILILLLAVANRDLLDLWKRVKCLFFDQQKEEQPD